MVDPDRCIQALSREQGCVAASQGRVGEWECVSPDQSIEMMVLGDQLPTMIDEVGEDVDSLRASSCRGEYFTSTRMR
jgi:hypothetical protein